MKWLSIVLVAMIAFAVQIHFRCPIDAVYDEQAANRPLPAALRDADGKWNASKVQRAFEHDPFFVGPESFASNGDGNVYTGLANGWIVRVAVDDALQWTFEKVVQLGQVCAPTLPNLEIECNVGQPSHEVEPTCGRALGMHYDRRTDSLIVATAYRGLVRLHNVTTGISQCSTIVDGAQLMFANALVVADDGNIAYLTDSSARFRRRDVMLEVLEASATGRLLAVDLNSGHVRVLADHLQFPNGLAMTDDGSALLFASTTGFAVYRYDLQTSKVTACRQNLPGAPDNIVQSPRSPKHFWLGLGTKRTEPFSLIDALAKFPRLRNSLATVLPSWLLVAATPQVGIVLDMGECGNSNSDIELLLYDNTGRSAWISEAHEINSNIVVFGSWRQPYLAFYTYRF